MKSNMVSNDEDLELFLDEFITLLNKYHYSPSPYRLKKITPPDYYIAGFQSQGDGIFHPMYVTKEVYYEDKNEN
jgi:hypothetical protein